jgi:uncharacterized protein YbjT (DUF2867 family)
MIRKKKSGSHEEKTHESKRKQDLAQKERVARLDQVKGSPPELVPTSETISTAEAALGPAVWGLEPKKNVEEEVLSVT